MYVNEAVRLGLWVGDAVDVLVTLPVALFDGVWVVLDVTDFDWLRVALCDSV